METVLPHLFNVLL